MLERQEKIALVLIGVVLCICVISSLVLHTVGKSPFAQNFSQASSEGSLVFYEGIVQKVVVVGSGNSYILHSGSVQVFIPSSASQGITVAPGDTISLYGKVQTWKGQREILVENSGDIIVTAGSSGKNLRS